MPQDVYGTQKTYNKHGENHKKRKSGLILMTRPPHVHHMFITIFLILLFGSLLVLINTNFAPRALADDGDRYSTNISGNVRVEVYDGDEDYTIVVKILDDYNSSGNFEPSFGNLTAAIVRDDGKKTMEVIDEEQWNGSSSTILNAAEAGNYTIYGGVEHEGTTYFDRVEFEIKEPEENYVPVAVAVMVVRGEEYTGSDEISFYLSEEGYEDVIFDGSRSYDLNEEDNDTLQYRWLLYYEHDNYTISKDGKMVTLRFNDHGRYQVELRVSDRRALEGEYGNTTLNFTILYKPDLQFETAPSLQKDEYEIGQDIDFSFWLINKGKSNSEVFNISAVLIRQTLPSETLVYETVVQGLSASSPRLINVSISTLGFAEARYDLELMIDNKDVVDELNEENNNMTLRNITLYKKPILFVNLILKNITLEKDINEEIPLGEGIGLLSPVTITVTIENRGGETAYWPELKLYIDNETEDAQRVDEVRGNSERKVRFVWYSFINGTRNISVELRYEGELLGREELDLYVVSYEGPPNDKNEEEGFFAESNLDDILLWGGTAAIAIAVIMVILSRYSEKKIK